jgi:hypothetical protein
MKPIKPLDPTFDAIKQPLLQLNAVRVKRPLEALAATDFSCEARRAKPTYPAPQSVSGSDGDWPSNSFGYAVPAFVLFLVWLIQRLKVKK